MKAMWRMIILTVSMMWSAAVLNAQSQDEWKVISALVGEDVENMNEHEVERLQALLVRPVRINTATLTRLVDSGLFTRYQAASLIDYRNRSGAVMSFMELATIDGFGQEFTDRIRPFLDKVGDIWMDNAQDWRFGQLMYNFICEMGDPFYWEEEDFLAKLEEYFAPKEDKQC